MVNPLIPIALAVGSAGANYIGHKQAEDAREDALAAQRIRNRNLDKQSFAINDQSRERFENVDTQQAERSDSLADIFRSASAAAPAETTAPVMPNSGNVVLQNRAREASDEAREFTDQRAEALADFRSFGDLFGSIGRAQARDAGELGMLGGFRRGSQSVLPLELDAASREGSNMRLLGDLLQMGSMMTTGPSLTKGGSMAGIFGGV